FSLRQSQACSGGVSSFIRSELSVVFLQVILCPACRWWLPLAFGYFTLQSCRAGISAESRRSELRRFALSDLAQPRRFSAESLLRRKRILSHESILRRLESSHCKRGNARTLREQRRCRLHSSCSRLRGSAGARHL